MSGYYGYSMSNNAVNAYDNGEKPLSKWRKKDILELSLEYTTVDISKLTIKELKENMLKLTSWHHTSMYYNKTDFYSLDINYLEKITQDDVNDIINSRKTKENKTPQMLEAERKLKIEKEIRKKERNRKKYLETLFKYQSNYKGLKMFVERVSNEGVEKLEAFRVNAIQEKREELRMIWTKQNHTWGLNHIDDDNFIERYVTSSIKF